MEKKNIIIVALGIVTVILAIVLIVTIYHSKNVTDQTGYGPGTPNPTRTAAPSNVVVPDEGSKAAAGIAIPSVQVPAAPDVASSFRNFSISIKGNAYSPSTIIVNQGDTVNLMITSVDGNYAFTQPDYGFNDLISKGKTQRIQFQAVSTGKFTFYCSACGGPSKGPVGYLIVANPPAK
jgi:heme/copper-type cytochrome/quinol oxidase subunit 2